jgi:Skp family chaperone for outer membrane proteins
VQNANDMATTAEERARYKKSAEDVALDLQIRNETITNYIYTSENHLHDEMVQHVTNLTAEIRGVMAAMAKKQGYTLVLDRTAETATGNPLILYTSGENDLTEPLIKELNSTAPATLAPEPKPASMSPILPIPDLKAPDKPVPK